MEGEIEVTDNDLNFDYNEVMVMFDKLADSRRGEDYKYMTKWNKNKIGMSTIADVSFIYHI